MTGEKMPNYNLHFPLQKGLNGFFSFNTTVKDAVKENIKNVLFTPKGSRVYLCDYGTDLTRMIHEPKDNVLKSKMRAQIYDALNKWVPNIRLDRVDVFYKQDLQGGKIPSVVLSDEQVFVAIYYTIKSTDEQVELRNNATGFIFG